MYGIYLHALQLMRIDIHGHAELTVGRRRRRDARIPISHIKHPLSAYFLTGVNPLDPTRVIGRLPCPSYFPLQIQYVACYGFMLNVQVRGRSKSQGSGTSLFTADKCTAIRQRCHAAKVVCGCYFCSMLSILSNGILLVHPRKSGN